MAGDFNAGALKGLEDNDVRLVGDGAGVEGEGHLDLAAGGLRREGGLSRHRLAIHLKRLRREAAVLIGLLHLHGTLQGVFLTGDDAGVFHGVHDDRLVIGDDVLVAVDAVQGGGGDERVLDRDGLRLVLHVRMGGDFNAVLLKGLEGHDFRVVGDGQGVEVEHHIDLAVGLLGREGGFSGDRLAVHLKSLLRDVALLVGHLHMEAALQGVGLAGDDVLVLHGVDDRGLAVGHDVLIAVMAVQRGSADLRAGDRGGLLAVLDVLMAGDFNAGALKGLEGDELGLVLEGEGVEGEGHIDGALGRVRREDGLRLHGLAVHLQRLAVDVPLAIGLLDMEGALDGVLLAGDEVLVGNAVGDGRLVVGRHALIAVSGVHGGGADFRDDDSHLLVHVGLVRVLGDEGAAVIV